MKINASTNSQVERLCDLKIYAISVLSFIGSVCAPDKATLKAENHALQCTTAGPYNAIPSNLLGVGCVYGWWASTPSALRPAIELLHADPRFTEVLKKSVRHAGTIALLSLLFLLLGNMSFFFHPRPSTQRMHLILFVGWTVMTHLMKFRKTKNRKLPLGYFWTNSIDKTLLVLSLAVPQEF